MDSFQPFQIFAQGSIRTNEAPWMIVQARRAFDILLQEGTYEIASNKCVHWIDKPPADA
jgi:hypothetical protein